MTTFGGLRVSWLQAFVAVVATGKRTAAASELGVDQATVSRHVQSLELWLGRLLFDLGVPARLLPDGEDFLPVAQEVLRLLEEARLRPLSAGSIVPLIIGQE